ncbi:MAG: hypothetical protein HOV79_34590 [Hamadaea sp.]|nr:hypothetical protein [Hamadaea sp.]
MRRTLAAWLAAALVATVISVVTAGLGGPAAAAVTPPGGSFTGVAPARLLDTRTGNGAPAGQVAAGGSVTVLVAGRGGVPATGVASVVLNVTVTGPAAGGWVTVHPAGTTRPTASNLNYNTGQTVANLVTVGLGTGGTSVTLFTSAKAHLIADVTGWYATAATASDRAGLFHPLRPARIADSRTSFGFATPGAGVTRTLQVTGAGGVPASGAAAVVVNVTVANPSTAGYLTVFPFGQTRPTASNLNFAAHDVRANRVITALGTGGKISVYNATGTTPVIVDVVGWFTDATAAPGTGGAYFVSMAPKRLVDTRVPIGEIGGAIGPDEAAVQTVAPSDGVPAGSGSVFPVAVVGNLTAVSPTTGGYLTAFPPGFGKVGESVPNTSDLNFVAGDVVPNLVITQLHAGALGIFNKSGTTHVIFDVSGFFALPTTPLTLSSVYHGANDQLIPVMSRNGQHFAVSSWASNLVAGDTNDVPDAFVIDKAANTATRVSVSTAGAQADDATWEVAISDDGRYVAFVSGATNLVTGDTNEATDVFVRDTVAATTTRVSVGPGGEQADNWSYGISMSADGTKIAFLSLASNLVADDTNGAADVFVADLTSGAVSRVSLSSAEAELNADVQGGLISGGGGHVAFITLASNVVAGDTNAADDVFVRDIAGGTTSRENVSTGGGQAQPGAFGSTLTALSISDDGNLVVFGTWSPNLVTGDTNDNADVFLRDRAAGTTVRITAGGGVQPGGDTGYISGDGSTILFTADPPGLSPQWRDSYGATTYVLDIAGGVATPIRGYDYLSPIQTGLSTDGNLMLVYCPVDDPLPGDSNSYLLTLP